MQSDNSAGLDTRCAASGMNRRSFDFAAGLLPCSACVLLPENAALVSIALAALPPVASSAASTPAPTAGDVAALDFLAGLWSFLYHQLQLLGAERDAKEAAAKAAAVPAEADSKTTMDADSAAASLSTEQAASFDPFAAFAFRRAQMASSGNGSSEMLDGPTLNPIDAELSATAAASDEEYEERCLGYRTLASLCSLLLGFFAVSPPLAATHRARILASLHLADFSPLVRLISEFLLLQSDAQLLQQEGLQASFDMLQALKKCDRIAANSATAAAEAAPECSTFEDREKKRARLSASPPATAKAATEKAVTSPPASSPPLGRSSSSAARFDALFGAQR